jgi:hypothetical protein
MVLALPQAWLGATEIRAHRYSSINPFFELCAPARQSFSIRHRHLICFVKKSASEDYLAHEARFAWKHVACTVFGGERVMAGLKPLL